MLQVALRKLFTAIWVAVILRDLTYNYRDKHYRILITLLLTETKNPSWAGKVSFPSWIFNQYMRTISFIIFWDGHLERTCVGLVECGDPVILDVWCLFWCLFVLMLAPERCHIREFTWGSVGRWRTVRFCAWLLLWVAFNTWLVTGRESGVQQWTQPV